MTLIGICVMMTHDSHEILTCVCLSFHLPAQPVQGEVLILRNRYPQPPAPISLAKIRIDTIVKPKILILIPRPGELTSSH